MEAVTPTCPTPLHHLELNLAPTHLTRCLTLSCRFTWIGASYKVLSKDSKRGLQSSCLSMEGRLPWWVLPEPRGDQVWQLAGLQAGSANPRPDKLQAQLFMGVERALFTSELAMLPVLPNTNPALATNAFPVPWKTALSAISANSLQSSDFRASPPCSGG